MFLHKVRPSSILDIGVGNGKMGYIARDYLDVMLGERYKKEDWRIRIDGIEVFPDYIQGHQKAIYDHIYIGDAFEVIDGLGKYDLIIIGDVLEHFEKERAWEFADKCADHSNSFMLFNIPLGERWTQGPIYSNPFEVHRSFWSYEEFAPFVAEKSLFHSPGTGDYGCFLVNKVDYIRHRSRHKFRRIEAIYEKREERGEGSDHGDLSDPVVEKDLGVDWSHHVDKSSRGEYSRQGRREVEAPVLRSCEQVLDGRCDEMGDFEHDGDMIYHRNLLALRALDPILADAISASKVSSDIHVLATKKGIPSLKVGAITIHSLHDPEREAEEWVRYHLEDIEKASSIVVLGFGLGYHLFALSKVTDKDIIVFEPRLDILKTALEHLDLVPLLARIKIISDRRISGIGRGFIVLEHRPSIKLDPQGYESIQSRLKVLDKLDRGLKVAVVSPIYGGSFPVARFCAEALKRLGHKVDFIDNSPFEAAYMSIRSITRNKAHQNQLREMFVHFISETNIARFNEFKPDLILALAQAPLGIHSLRKLKENNVPTAFWFVEDFRLMEYWKEIAPLYDYFFTIQKGEFLDRLRERGSNHFHYLPLAASTDIHRKLNLSKEDISIYGSDISFVGAGYYNRKRFFEGLLDYDFKIWGNEWDLNSPLGRCIQRSGERIGTEETVRIFNATKININLHSSTYHEGVNPYGDYVNPRTFEIAACEAFQLVDYRSELPELFKPGEEIVYFKNREDLRDKIRYYLDRPREREEMARRARERVLRDHTYEHRMEEMIQFIFHSGFSPPRWDGRDGEIDRLVKAAGKDTELGKYLAQFLDRGDVSLDDLVESIHSGKGALTRIEKMFLLMHEMRKVYMK